MNAEIAKEIVKYPEGRQMAYGINGNEKPNRVLNLVTIGEPPVPACFSIETEERKIYL